MINIECMWYHDLITKPTPANNNTQRIFTSILSQIINDSDKISTLTEFKLKTIAFYTICEINIC